ncbi:hypothetical protein C8245_21325 [Paracidovorax avenae]|nr:hypothetical protein C8245_21325 [Paracidovorax avenae]
MALLASCVEIFGHPRFSDLEPMRVFFRAVGCVDEEVVVAALCEWLKSGRKFPTPADIRDLIAARDLGPTKKEVSHG